MTLSRYRFHAVRCSTFTRRADARSACRSFETDDTPFLPPDWK
ncbi:hypothetical protein ACFO8N_00605 [Sneathiella chungangensis]|nr:hypothetical protein [Sneathiella chungangensis]